MEFWYQVWKKGKVRVCSLHGWQECISSVSVYTTKDVSQRRSLSEIMWCCLHTLESCPHIITSNVYVNASCKKGVVCFHKPVIVHQRTHQRKFYINFSTTKVSKIQWSCTLRAIAGRSTFRSTPSPVLLFLFLSGLLPVVLGQCWSAALQCF